jgi:MHS family alpha-ketoglutarate permease-like MFS transporter
LALTSYPIMSTLARTHDFIAALLLQLAALAFFSGYSAINSVLKAELYPAHVRALGVALPYAIANAVCGGTAEYVALWFKDDGHEPYFYVYVCALCAVALGVSIFMRDTKRASLILED